MAGTSPFVGAGQFGKNATIYRRKFLNHTDAMLEILEASYTVGGRGIEVLPIGKICEAAKIMRETHEDYVVTGSTYPGHDPLIEELIDIGAKIIFVHGMIADNINNKLIKLLDDISSRRVIPGIATHDPISTLEFAIERALTVKAFLIPFNVNGLIMGNQKKLEDLIDNNKKYSFLGMKTLAAGKLEPQKAFKYISKHNICSVTIGMVSVEEARESTKIALNFLQK